MKEQEAEHAKRDKEREEELRKKKEAEATKKVEEALNKDSADKKWHWAVFCTLDCY